MEQNKDLKLLAEKVEDIRVAMLTTVDEEGALISRPMATSEIDAEGNLWFFTQLHSPKIHDVDLLSEVNISYAEVSKELYVSISGKAEIVKDRAKIKELWTPLLKAWFPKGEDDPNLVLLKVHISKAQYWDSPGNRLVQLAGMAKAMATGKPYAPGENKKIKVQ